MDQGKLCWDPAELKKQQDDAKWREIYNHLVAFGMDNDGDCNVPYSHVVTLPDDQREIKLGNWLSNQRMSFKANNLRQDRLNMLQELVDQNKLLWEVDMNISKYQTNDISWREMYDHLVTYGKEHDGDCNVSYNYEVPSAGQREIKLGNWLSIQRGLFKSRSLPQERFDLFQELIDQGNLNWRFSKGNKSDNAQWKEMYDKLETFGDDHEGDCNVPSSYKCTSTDDIKLSNWLNNQRIQFKKDALQPYRFHLLQNLVDQNKLRWNESMKSKVTNRRI